MASEWEYHQDGRDRATTLGCAGIIGIAIVIAALLMAVVARTTAGTAETEVVHAKADGSNAGANAVTFEELAKEEWRSGEWSVTTQDLANKPEPGSTYPSNGKDTPLESDTTYGKGAGMVDIVTYDKATNVEIRHFGQLQEDGTVRWYAAETIVDAQGVPVRMESE